jgi:chemotaxis protein methyltransferase CheR
MAFMVELGIVDIREITRIIRKFHNYDFSDFALTSFKYNLERVMAQNGITNSEGLIRKLSDDPTFFDLFLFGLFVPSTEMFRDPSLWRWLREDYFPSLPPRHFDNFKVWIPINNSGAELYTLCILLKELDILDKVRIFATVFSDHSLNYIKEGKYPLKKLEISIENYKRFHGTSTFDQYYTLKDNIAVRDNSLINSVEFIKDDITFSKAPQNVKLLLFRNSGIYYNPSMQISMLKKMNQQMSAAGNIIIGIKESIKNPDNLGFEIMNENESVYKRKI